LAGIRLDDVLIAPTNNGIVRIALDRALVAAPNHGTIAAVSIRLNRISGASTNE
jgi:hypothetical protein